MLKLHSKVDSSVNWIEDDVTGYFESRFVQRQDDYIICYLSSQTGCNQGCKFCHLTTTGQIRSNDAGVPDFSRQALKVVEYYRDHVRKGDNGYIALNTKTKKLHYNFMARGEPLANKTLAHPDLYDTLTRYAKYVDLEPVFNISTIMPKKFKGELADYFPEGVKPTIYYSIYSVNAHFRVRWIPAAQDLLNALTNIDRYCHSGGKVVLHSSFIKEENDSVPDVNDMIELIKSFSFANDYTPVAFNIVRYNPYSSVQGDESPYLDRIAQQMTEAGINARVLNRVGPDVYASCGAFITSEQFSEKGNLENI